MTLTTDKQLGPYEILSPLRRRWGWAKSGAPVQPMCTGAPKAH